MNSQVPSYVSLMLNLNEADFIENRILKQQLLVSSFNKATQLYAFQSQLGKGYFKFYCLSNDISCLIFQIKTQNQAISFNLGNQNAFICLDSDTDKKSKEQKAILNTPSFVIPAFTDSKIVVFGNLPIANYHHKLFPLSYAGYKVFKQIFENNESHFSTVFQKHSQLYKLASCIINELTDFVKIEQISSMAETDIKTLLLLEKNELKKQDFSNETSSIEQLAQAACMSPTKFKKSFKILFGETPHQYFLNYKMDIAKKLILHKNHSVSEIAHRVGYNSVGRFSMAFQNRFHILPSKI